MSLIVEAFFLILIKIVRVVMWWRKGPNDITFKKLETIESKPALDTYTKTKVINLLHDVYFQLIRCSLKHKFFVIITLEF